ncbi:MAG: hypothetical protein OEO23_15095 [Gemmatimonadota bacterium]|nr:hypothetical protein [Gemmatimonadota bacterium]
MNSKISIANRVLGPTALILTLVTAACQDSPVAPDLAPDALAFDGGPSNMTTTSGETVLTWDEALQETVTVSAKIGRWGGMLSMDGILTLTVPYDALDRTTELSMTAFAGEDVAFEFGPHGTQFNRPVSIWLDLCAIGAFRNDSSDPKKSTKRNKKNDSTGSTDSTAEACDSPWWEGSGWTMEDAPVLDLGGLVAVYFTEAGPEVETLEIIDVSLEFNRYLRFRTDHFSGYALAW